MLNFSFVGSTGKWSRNGFRLGLPGYFFLIRATFLGPEPLITVHDQTQPNISCLESHSVSAHANFTLARAPLGEAVALLEARTEFLRRFRPPPPGAAPTPPLPLLTSHCPGWTCYAEKAIL